jgi:hypothetical protein
MQSTDPLRAELFVRADTFGTHDLQTDIRRRLARLDDENALDGVAVSTWQSRVRLDAPDSADEARAIEQFDSFGQWAERAGVSLEPFFETWTRYSAVLDEGYEELVTPVVCLALFDGSDVVEVAPHRTDEGTYTVRDCLATLESRATDDGAIDSGDEETDETVELTVG